MNQLALLRTRKFAAFFWTQFLGAFNDNLFKNALVILVAYKSLSVGGLPPCWIVVRAGQVGTRVIHSGAFLSRRAHDRALPGSPEARRRPRCG